MPPLRAKHLPTAKAAEQRLPAHAVWRWRRPQVIRRCRRSCSLWRRGAPVAFVCRHSRQAPAASAYADAVCLRAERLARLTLKRKEAFWIYIFLFRKGAKGMKQYVSPLKREHAPAVGRQRRQPGQMTGLGLPFRRGSRFPQKHANNYYENDKTLDEEITAQAMAAWRAWRKKTGKGFGDAKNRCWCRCVPALRSPCRGMMDTVLNLGLTDETARGMAERPRKTHGLPTTPTAGSSDVLRRGDGLDMTPFEAALEAAKQAGRKAGPRPERRKA